MQRTSTITGSNHLLSALPEYVFAEFSPYLKAVDLPHDFRLYSSNEPIEYIYFPDTGVASIIATTSDGNSIEAGMVGSEGAAGMEILMGARDSPNECVIQIAGMGRRIAARNALDLFAENDEFRRHALLFIHKLSMQVTQTALCNRLHQVEQRLAKWLLMSHDRVEGNLLPLTHEYLSIMLGVTRVSVSLTAAGFQNLELIKYSRGAITVTDREGLEDTACECYPIIVDEYRRTL